MMCPNCHKELKPETFKGVKIFECSECNGIFFTREELTLAKNNTDNDLRWLKIDLFEKMGAKYTERSGVKQCPKDTQIMDSLVYQHSNVVIHACKHCSGVWLDQGEFEKIIRYLEKIVASESAKGYKKEALNELFEAGRTHEDKISEIKDLLVITKLMEERFIIEHPTLEELIRGIVMSTPPGW